MPSLRCRCVVVSACARARADVKTQLLRYATTSMLFADRKVDANLVSFNRVILLHG